jgi:hypothetical protein
LVLKLELTEVVVSHKEARRYCCWSEKKRGLGNPFWFSQKVVVIVA